MVAIFVGAGAGFTRSSATVLGGAGVLGSAVLGRGGEAVSVNAATGNLVVSKQDEFLTGRGIDAAISRTYNSLGQTTDRDNGDGWQQSTTQRIFGLNQGSAVQRLGSDGSVVTYVWGIRDDEWAYWTTDGTGAHDKLVESGGNWVWTDGDSQTTETYAISTGSAEEWRIVERKDSDGNALTFTYLAGTDRLSKLTTANGEWMQYSWSGNQITKITTGYTDLGTSTAKTLTRARYTYDGQGRLAQVTVDLSPQNNSITDGKVYSTSYTYDGGSTRVASITQSDGSAVAFRYDAEGRVVRVSQTAAVGDVRVTNLAYQTGYTIVEAPDGKLTLLYHDDKGQLVQIVSADHEDLLSNSRFNGATGWNVWDHQGAAAGTISSVGTIDGRRYAEVSFNTANPYELISVRNDDQHWLDVVEGDLLLVSGTFDGTGPINLLHLYIHWLDANNQLLDPTFVGGQTPATGFGTALAKVVEVPVGAVRARYELYMGSSAAGSGSFRLIEPSVVSLSSADVVQFDYDEDGNLLRTIETDGRVLQPGFTGSPGSGGNPSTQSFGDNRVDISAWPQDLNNLPADTSLPGWNANNLAANGEWASWPDSGPYGSSVVSLQAYTTTAGQSTPVSTLNTNQAYQFTIYFRSNLATSHRLRIAVASPAGSVVRGDGGSLNGQRFIDQDLRPTNGFQPDHWYKIVGYVLPAGTAIDAVTQYGGVYDVETGAKIRDAEHFIWTGGASTFDAGLFFNVYPDSRTDLRSDFYRPEIRPVETAEIMTGSDLFDHATDRERLLMLLGQGGSGGGSSDPEPEPGAPIVYDANGRTTRFTYDTRGNIETTTDPLGNVVTYSYDDRNHRVSEKRLASDASGAAVSHTTRYVYDSFDHLRFAISPEGRVTEYRYHADGQVHLIIQYPEHVYPLNVSATSEGEMNAWRDGLADRSSTQVRQFIYDARGNLVQSFDYGAASVDGWGVVAEGYEHQYYTYDQAGRLLTQKTMTLNTENFIYDGMGRLIASTDLNGGTTTFAFDDANTTTVVTSAIGLVTTSVYNKMGELLYTRESSTPGDVARFRYDRAGRLKIATNAVGTNRYAVYDGLGRKTADINHLGEIMEYVYDDLDRLVASVRYNSAISGASLLALADPDNELTIDDLRPAAAANDLWQWTVYDANDRVTQTIAGDGSVASYAYDAAGRLVSTVQYANRLTAGQLAALRADPPAAPVLPTADAARDRVSRTFYDADGAEIGMLDGEGYLTEMVYDGAGRLVREIAYTIATSAALRASGSFDALRASVSPASAAHLNSYHVYDGQGLLRFTIDDAGYVTQNVYWQGVEWSATGLVRETISHATAISTTDFTYDNIKALVAGIANAANDRTASFIYDAAGRLVTSTDPSGLVTTHTYDIAGRAIRSQVGTGANARITRSFYDDQDRLRFTVDAEGYVDGFDYDPEDRVVAKTRYSAKVAATDSWTLATIGAANKGPVANARVTAYSYDATGRLVSMTDPGGVQTVYAYFANGTKSFEYYAVGADQVATAYQYDTSGGLIAETSAYGTSIAVTTTYSYDGQGNLRTATDPAGYTTSYTYDRRGQMLTQTNALGGIVSYQYDALGNAVKVTDARGNATYSYYDPLNRLKTVRDAENNVVEMRYNAFGETVGVTRYYNKTVSAVSTTTPPVVSADAARDASSYSFYDKLGRLVYSVDAESYVSRNYYNATGDLIRQVRYATTFNAGASTTKADLDAAFGNDQAALPAGAVASSYAHDRLGRVLNSTDARGYQRHYGYDAFDQLTGESNETGGDKLYLYDKRGRLIEEYVEFDDNGNLNSLAITRYQYDARGNRTKMIEGAGLPAEQQRVTEYEYDALNRLIVTRGEARAIASQASHLPVATAFVPTESVAYDSRGLVTRTLDAAGGKATFYYDALGRKVAEINEINAYTAYQYDENGNVKRITVYENPLQVPHPANGGGNPPPPPSGATRVTEFEYDRLDRLVRSSVLLPSAYKTGTLQGTSWTNETTASLDTRYQYDAFGNTVKTTDPNGTDQFAFYDRIGRKVAEVDGERYLTRWTYDSRGNVTLEYRFANKVGLQNGLVTQVGTTLQQLVDSALYGLDDRFTGYEYDAVDNRVSETRYNVRLFDPNTNTLGPAGGSYARVEYQYNGLGQVTRKTEATGDDVVYQYDQGGRLLSETRKGFTDFNGVQVSPRVYYTYDTFGNLTRTTAAGSASAADRVTTYQYDAAGMLTRQTDAEGNVHDYYYDALGRQIVDQYYRADSTGSLPATEAVLTGYDALGRVTMQTLARLNGANWAKGDITANEYNTFGDVVRSGLNGLWQTENKYDAAGRLWATNSGDGLWKYLGYDRNGNQTVAITAGGAGANLAGKTFSQAFAVIGNANVNASYTGYDKRNLATAMVEEGRQLGGVTTAITTARTYNSFGDVATETDALGAVTSYTYNTAGKLLRREGPAVSITLENGKQIWVKPSEDYFYDAAGRLVATRDANGSYAETGTSAANATVKNADTGNLTRFTLLAGTGYDGSQALITKQISADGGITRTGFDVHGDARKTEILIVGSEASGTWRTTTQSYDRLGRLTQVNQAGGLIDYYGYDSLGQRVKHWNNFLVDINGNPDVEQTDYDLQGRVRRTRAFGGDVTTIATSWDAGIAAISGIVTGGWHETTTMANYRTLDEKSDLVGRVVWKRDLGDHDTIYTYDDAGRQVSASMGGLTTSFTYFNTGLVATNSGPAGTASYTYDRNGNRLTEKLVNGSVVKDQTATYDALGRLKTWAENAGSTNPVADMAYEYDANGNIRRTLSHFRNLAETGLPWANATTRDYWFRFDNMNRLVTDKGRLSGTAGAAGTIIVRGTGGDGNNDGRTILYDLAGQRVSTLITTTMLGTRRVFVPDPDPGPGGVQPYAGGHYENQPVYYDGDRREDYAYDGVGQLVAIRVAESGYAVDEFSGEVTVTAPPAVGTLRSIFTYDTLGRMIDQFDKDKAGTNDVYHRRAYYNTKSQLIEEDVSTTKTDGYTYRQVNRFDYGTYGNYALGSVVQSLSNTYRNGSDSDNGDNASRYTFAWYDGAVQAQIQHDKHYDNNHTPGSPGMTQGAVLSGFDTEQYTNFTYNGFGQLTSAYVYDGMPRNVTFTLDELGQIVRRVETRPTNAPSQQAGSPHEAWYRFAGRQMGYTGNNGTSDLSLSASIAERAAASPSTVGTFRNGSTYGLPYADFAQSYDPINSYSQGSAGGSVTVQAGDTLQAIALRLYGDANLWYRIAQANGLSAGAALIEGQSLILPAGTIRSGHSASTFAPYDPAEATGDLSPTAPKPRKKPKCGVFGQILLAAVAIAVTALIKVPVTNFFAGIGGLAGTAVGLAATGAIANIASQAVGVATGIQDRFNWKAVGSAALRSVFAPQSTGNFAADFAFAVVSDAAYQTVAVATGLQSKFDWAGVAAAGVGHAVGGQIAGALGKASTGLGRAARDAASSAAYSLAYAATRSAIAGESFGRNIAASLPNVVAQALYGFGSAGLKGKGGGSDKPTDNAQQRAKQEKTAEAAARRDDPVVQQLGEQAAGNPVATTAQVQAVGGSNPSPAANGEIPIIVVKGRRGFDIPDPVVGPMAPSVSQWLTEASITSGEARINAYRIFATRTFGFYDDDGNWLIDEDIQRQKWLGAYYATKAFDENPFSWSRQEGVVDFLQGGSEVVPEAAAGFNEANKVYGELLNGFRREVNGRAAKDLQDFAVLYGITGLALAASSATAVGVAAVGLEGVGATATLLGGEFLISGTAGSATRAYIGEEVTVKTFVADGLVGSLLLAGRRVVSGSGAAPRSIRQLEIDVAAESAGPRLIPRLGPKGVDPLHHNANVLVRDAQGNVVAHQRFVSGNMTLEEQALGFPKNTLASHTEARAVRTMELEPGGSMTITGQLPPCKLCRGAMNQAMRDSGATIRYQWRQDGKTLIWPPAPTR